MESQAVKLTPPLWFEYTRTDPVSYVKSQAEEAGAKYHIRFMRTILTAIPWTLVVWNMPAEAQERTQARSMVISQQGIVATSQTLASQAGAQVLARGGSAVDAAIAANATLHVVEPMMNGMGGDLFAIYWEKRTGKLSAINASGWAPKGLTIEYLKSKGFSSMPQSGMQSVSVPGCVDGWEKLHKRFGKLK